MALGDLMTSRFSQLSLAVSNHVIDGNVSSGGYHDDDVASADLMSQRRDLDAASTSSYANAVTCTATVPTTMAYLPQTVVLCELRHAAFEASTPTGPSESGLASKWRPKDKVLSFLGLKELSFYCEGSTAQIHKTSRNIGQGMAPFFRKFWRRPRKLSLIFGHFGHSKKHKLIGSKNLDI
ncbi:hypothetical protein ES319_1Z151000v1 [Gossypium barbadense]|uniref:Uncharacterized protein n=2 Tax=Gossypium TaxID=3633 RepID=A0A5J5NCC2_GOSBA|nr:hypothetical protein ES319_1Z159400v1 [Gossypium barbadense]KAB1670607.1 hypothetical protein ES319_1Z153500v1 [Gossypium barbadense]KAB1670630.1 hypothetical protein ES319_1Z151000v1 [Gossypium barbadense]TYH56186.1 hypothetical protein ES332_D08G000500v1 [Gossypium tomentosum]